MEVSPSRPVDCESRVKGSPPVGESPPGRLVDCKGNVERIPPGTLPDCVAKVSGRPDTLIDCITTDCEPPGCEAVVVGSPPRALLGCVAND